MPASRSALRALGRDVADRGAALEVGLLGDQPHALEVLLEVALGEALALGDHAEAVRAGGLGGARVLEDLLGLHHRVHRRLGVGEARLRAEAAVLGAAAGLGVDQRAHVGRVGEALHARLPGALDQRFDLRVVLDLAEREGLLAGDQRRHAPTPYEVRGGRLFAAAASAAGGARRTRASPRACPARRRTRGAARSAPLRRPRAARPRRASSAAITRLLPVCDERRVGGQLARELERDGLELARPRRRG